MILISILQERSIGYNYGSDEATYGWLYKSWQSHPIFMVIEDISGYFYHKKHWNYYKN